MYNEGLKQGYREAKKQLEAMHGVIKRLDPTRPVTGNTGPVGGASSPDEINLVRDLINLADVIDVRGFNPDNYDEYHAEHPERPMVALETGYNHSTRGVYAKDDEKAYHSSYDSSAERTWCMVAETDYVAGGFVWNGIDYRGEPFPYDWPAITAQYGFMDSCGFPKDDYYYYQSSWSDETVLHLFPHWNWGNDQAIEVRSYSNCDSVELFLNGESKGRQDRQPYSSLSWKVDWEPGVLEAKCYRSGEVVAETRRETVGEPAGIALEPDRPSIDADGEDVSLVKVSILDEQGRVVPTAVNEVIFTVDGPARILGVGNGDPSSHEPDKGEKRRAFNDLSAMVSPADTFLQSCATRRQRQTRGSSTSVLSIPMPYSMKRILPQKLPRYTWRKLVRSWMPEGAPKISRCRCVTRGTRACPTSASSGIVEECRTSRSNSACTDLVLPEGLASDRFSHSRAFGILHDGLKQDSALMHAEEMGTSTRMGSFDISYPSVSPPSRGLRHPAFRVTSVWRWNARSFKELAIVRSSADPSPFNFLQDLGRPRSVIVDQRSILESDGAGQVVGDISNVFGRPKKHDLEYGRALHARCKACSSKR